MLIKSKTIRNYKLKGIDGEVGSVKEFYFDDKFWTVRYLVANTGGWLNSRQVLISPYFLLNVDHDDELIHVDLTKNQIENSPSLDMDVPVSRQYEESYYSYYGAPLYWAGPNMWGSDPFIGHDREQWKNTGGERIDNPDSEISDNPGIGVTGSNTDLTNSGNPATINSEDTWDSSLRSSKDVSGHKIHATDEDKIGHVDDFIIDDETWTIRYLVINTGNVFTGKKVLISPEWIDHISWDDSRVYINLTKESIKESPEYSDENGLTRDYESSLFGFYKKNPYWSPEPVSHDYTRSQVNTEGKYSGY